METTESPLAVLEEETQTVSGLFDAFGSFIRGILPSLGFAAFVLLCGIVFVRLFLKMIHRTVEKSKIDKTAGRFLESLIGVLLYVLVAVIVLSVLKVPMTSIITVIGTAGIAISLALQNSLSNVAGGFLLLFSKPLKVGDFIEFDSLSGTVESVGILQTKLRRPDGTTVFIPNGKLSDAVILNYSETPERRLDLEFGIGYGSDAEAAKTLILEKIAKHPYTLQNPAPTVRIGSLGDSAVMLWVRVWTTHVHYWEVHYDLQEQVYEAFRENGIEIPYPQLDIHTDPKGDPT